MHKSNMSAITICKIYLFILYSFWTLCSCSEVTFEHDVKMTKDETVVNSLFELFRDTPAGFIIQFLRECNLYSMF